MWEALSWILAMAVSACIGFAFFGRVFDDFRRTARRWKRDGWY